MKYYSFDLNLDKMILVLKLDLDIVKMYVCTKNEVPTFSGSKVLEQIHPAGTSVIYA